MILDKESLYQRYGGSAGIKFGRGRYLSVPITQNGTERLIIRDYKHGGLLGKLFDDIFCNGNRPFKELHLHEIAFQRGVPSAEAIAVVKRKLWGWFYKASFISKEISGAIDVVQFLKESSFEDIQKSKRPAISAIAKLIRKMHDAGIYHADLHLKNILLKKAGNKEFSVYIIDFDKSVAMSKLDIKLRMKNLLRLDRFIEKLRVNQKIDLISKIDRIRFFRYYMWCGDVLDTDWKQYIRRYQSDHMLHKLWWRILGS